MQTALTQLLPRNSGLNFAIADFIAIFGHFLIVFSAISLPILYGGALAIGLAGALLLSGGLLLWRTVSSKATVGAQLRRIHTAFGTNDLPPATARSEADDFDQVHRIALHMTTYHAALDSSKSGLVIFDMDGAIAFMSKRARNLFKSHQIQFSEQDASGQNHTQQIGSKELFEFIQSNKPEICKNMYDEKLPREQKFRTQLGDEKFEVHFYESLAPDGALTGYYAEFFNISSEVTMEVGISELLDGFKQGNVYSRLNLEEDDSVRNQFLNKVTSDLNDLLDVVSELIADIDSAVMAMVAGDMTAKMTGDYSGEFESLKESLNESISTFESTLISIGDIARRVGDATEGVAATSGKLRALMERQQDALTETTGAIASIAASIKGNAENAEGATLLSQETSRRANDGRRVIGEAQEAMASIEESSSKIDDITKTIDAIAFQTNLLALNAAVEAARAGGAGKGFAIVAQEVRNLAKRSSDAAKNIQNLVEETKGRINNGSERVGEAAGVLEGIAASARETSAKMSEIKTTTTNQGESAEAIMRTTGSMEEVTHDSTCLSAENAEIAERLREHVASLKEDLGYFILSEEASTGDFSDRVAV